MTLLTKTIYVLDRLMMPPMMTQLREDEGHEDLLRQSSERVYSTMRAIRKGRLHIDFEEEDETI